MLMSAFFTDTSFFLLEEGQKYYVRTKILNNASGCENELYDQIVIDSVRLDFEVIKRQCLNDNPVLFDDNSKPNGRSHHGSRLMGAPDKNLCLSRQTHFLTIACVGA